MDLRIKEGTSISNHLNDVNTINSNLVAQEVEFLDSIKALFLLITLSNIWDTFLKAISSFAPPSGLIEANVANSLLTKRSIGRTLIVLKVARLFMFGEGLKTKESHMIEQGQRASLKAV